MAAIRLRQETNTLYFDFRYEGIRFREQTNLKDTKANRKRMEKVLEKIELAIVDGTFDYATFFPNSPKAKTVSSSQKVLSQAIESVSGADVEVIMLPTVKEAFEIWMSENEVLWRKATIKAIHSMFNTHILPEFGDTNLRDLSRDDILNFRKALADKEVGKTQKKLSAKTINEILNSFLAMITSSAERYGFINPGTNIKRLKVNKKHVDPLSLTEVDRFLNAVRSDYREYFIVRLFTGMRTGEVHGLKWMHIDFERAQILVRETYSNGNVEYTKNDGSQRDIQMSSMVIKALMSLRQKTNNPNGYVFSNDTGGPTDSMWVYKNIWIPTLKFLGLRTRRLYETRHTAATLWLAAGENPEWIAKQLGHVSTEMLFRIYSRFIPNLTRNDGSAIEKLLSENIGG